MRENKDQKNSKHGYFLCTGDPDSHVTFKQYFNNGGLGW